MYLTICLCKEDACSMFYICAAQCECEQSYLCGRGLFSPWQKEAPSVIQQDQRRQLIVWTLPLDKLKFVNLYSDLMRCMTNHLPSSIRKDPGPRQREAEHFDAQILHDADVVLVEIVEVVCRVSCVSVVCLARSVGESIPDARLPPILVHWPLNLCEVRPQQLCSVLGMHPLPSNCHNYLCGHVGVAWVFSCKHAFCSLLYMYMLPGSNWMHTWYAAEAAPNLKVALPASSSGGLTRLRTCLRDMILKCLFTIWQILANDFTGTYGGRHI